MDLMEISLLTGKYFPSNSTYATSIHEQQLYFYACKEKGDMGRSIERKIHILYRNWVCTVYSSNIVVSMVAQYVCESIKVKIHNGFVLCWLS